MSKRYIIYAIIALLILASIAFLFQNNYKRASLILNGKNIGIIDNISSIDKAIEIANKKIKEINSEFFFDPTIKTTDVYSFKFDLDKYELSDIIYSELTPLTNAWVVNKNGKDIAALKDRDDALDALSNFKSSFLRDKNQIVKSIDFIEEVEILYEPIGVNKIMTKDEFIDYLHESIKDTIISNRPEDGLAKYNGYNEGYVKFGDGFDVLIKDELDEKIILHTSTIFNFDETLDKGESIVEREGQDGLIARKSENAYINNRIVYTKVLKENIIREPISQIIRVGDRSLLSKLRFKWPATGYITSKYGPRYDGFHRGLDIGSGLGANILASAAGEVIHAGYSGSYGYCVFIRHRDGYETRYAHLLKIEVDVGDRVSAGDIVGKMGSSGNSTGAHLHFEILKDGETLDPEDEL